MAEAKLERPIMVQKLVLHIPEGEEKILYPLVCPVLIFELVRRYFLILDFKKGEEILGS